ncbi:hypothetical protein NS115_10330 [Paenibacillus jamilae]|uniref:Uncharacterized protein n=1 Tax=Paenibacillus jamilae TaxID=114136 RepID=A0ACC4ZW34_9BACL|nr:MULTISPECIES: hypothetical protein [Paenibacillus]AUO06808.1 hypothetical protein C0638_09775 [Paenibacillus sp. lzh-N1]KTS82838.1 hypothetical protein NS115_10330 [Paenibacillus jamilae]
MTETHHTKSGPAYLDGWVIPETPEAWGEQEWTGKLRSQTGNTKFHIFYYGEFMDELIAVTVFAPQLIIAEDAVTGEQIVIFDGTRHGYDALLCEVYTEEQQNNRTPLLPYLDDDGEDTFEVTVTAFYNVDWDDEFADDVDENGQLELISGERCDFEEAKRNGFDAISITITSAKGLKTEILQEELA